MVGCRLIQPAVDYSLKLMLLVIKLHTTLFHILDLRGGKERQILVVCLHPVVCERERTSCRFNHSLTHSLPESANMSSAFGRFLTALSSSCGGAGADASAAGGATAAGAAGGGS